MKRTFLALLALLAATFSYAEIPVSGKPLKAGGPEGLAPLSLNRCIQNCPVGFAHMSEAEQADLVVFAPSGLDIALWQCAPDGEDADGHAIYRKVTKLTNPWGKKPGNAIVFEDEGSVYMLKLSKTKLLVSKWDGDRTFAEPEEKKLYEMPDNVRSFSVIRRDRRTLEVAFLFGDGKEFRPEELNYNTASLYDGAGSYRGNFTYCGLGRMFLDNDFNQVDKVEQVSTGNDMILSGSSVSIIEDKGYVVTNIFGSMKFLKYFKKLPKGGVESSHLRTADGKVYTFPCHGADAVSIPAPDGSRTRLVVGGECALYTMDLLPQGQDGTLAYGPVNLVMEKEAPLYGGSLTVPNVVDWDGDGVLDIVSGNSEARILFFKNCGTDAEPDFRQSVELEAAGIPILLRPGYYVTQGPGEGAWGYAAPTVFDWNGDGLPDIVTSGSIAHYKVYLNVGTKTDPQLAAPFDLHCDGLQLHGVWRVRPAIAKIGEDVYILTQDDGNALHLYRRVDDSNVEDCGRVKLKNGDIITGHNGDKTERLGMGQWGRAKLRFYDWDGDGDQDLFVGCIKRASFPRPGTGLPYRRFKAKKTGMQVLYFENIGGPEASAMKFAEPKQLVIDGKDVPLGAHSNAPEPCLLGDTSDGANLLVGCESGKYYFYQRSHIGFVE